MNKAEFLQLVDKYLAGNASLEEEQLLLNFFNSFQAHAEWDEQLLGAKQALEDKMLQRIQAAMRAGKPQPGLVRLLPFRKIAVAAAVVVLIASGTWYLFSQRHQPERYSIGVRPGSVAPPDIEPGGNKAILTLSDGSQVTLNDAKNGLVAQSGAVSIQKVKDGQLAYQQQQNKPIDANAPVAYNTVTTPIGGQYQVVLPDGTAIWLNAASSVRYPTMFTGSERVVELTGEGYFEVAKNAAKPFVVKVNDAEVKVLGTHFNIMAYENEPTLRTTLLEGSVQLRNAGNTNLLKPGQQGVIGKDGHIKIQSVDTDHEIAWKNGLFDFNRSNIREIMNQLSRWYGTEVTYSGHVPEDEFVGKISRSEKLSDVLNILRLSHIQLKVEDKKIIVTP